jgi:hypothetical protein
MSESMPLKTNGLPTLADFLTIGTSFYPYGKKLALAELFSAPSTEQAAPFLDDVLVPSKGRLTLLDCMNKAVLTPVRRTCLRLTALCPQISKCFVTF